MPFNGAGLFTRIYSWVTDEANGLFVDATRTDTDSDDIAQGLSNCVTRDGQSPALANIPMGSFKITGLANGTVAADAVNYGQVFTGPTFSGLTATGAVNFAGATTVTVPTVAPGDNSTKAASTAFATQLAFSAALPAISKGFTLSNDGTTALFSQSVSFAVNLAKAADVASAATPDIWSGDGNTLHITGTTALTGFTAAPQAGACRTLYFDGACLLTNGANFNVQGGANYTTSAGDLVDVYADTTTKFYLFIRKADGFPIRGGMAYIASQVPLAQANFDMLTVCTATYDNYLIIGEGLTANGTDTLRGRFANAGTTDTTTSYISNTATLASAALADNMQFGLSVIAGNGGASFTMHLTNANDTSGRMKSLGGHGSSQDGAATYGVSIFSAGYKKAAAISGFRLYWSGGALFGATGVVRVYGYNNS